MGKVDYDQTANQRARLNALAWHAVGDAPPHAWIRGASEGPGARVHFGPPRRSRFGRDRVSRQGWGEARGVGPRCRRWEGIGVCEVVRG